MKYYTIDEETLQEYISLKKLELGSEIVEHLASIRDDIDDPKTKEFLQEYIDKYAEEYCICPNCFCELEPIIHKEYHDEVDNWSIENTLDGYKCDSCGRIYD